MFGYAVGLPAVSHTRTTPARGTPVLRFLLVFSLSLSLPLPLFSAPPGRCGRGRGENAARTGGAVILANPERERRGGAETTTPSLTLRVRRKITDPTPRLGALLLTADGESRWRRLRSAARSARSSTGF